MLNSKIKESFKNIIRKSKDSYQLAKLPFAKVKTENLISIDNSEKLFTDVFKSNTADEKWNNVYSELQSLGLPENTGGVNAGDQRAIAYLIWYFKPLRILEIGTHIGCSTVYLSIAQRELQLHNDSAGIITVDIRDVNDEEYKPWVEYKSPMSPKELVTYVRYNNKIEFKCSPSVEFLSKCEETFDFIFLDGGHSAELVYKELPLASKLLNRNGIILLHDYFPNNRSIWKNGTVIPGPFMATKRLINEGNDIKISPLGALPWGTKEDSNNTSLALCTRG